MAAEIGRADAGAHGAVDADADPVVARFSVFLKPQLPAHQKMLVLQYPNKAAQPGGGGGPAPTELRIKGTSGMVEVDVPMDIRSAYDRSKGMAWGAALASSTKAKAGGSHGLAGGFGVGGQQGNRGGRGGGGGAGSRAATAEAAAAGYTPPLDWPEAVRQDRVLRLQTLGGMCPPARSAEARWMIGVFDGGNLHLTPVNSLVHLRPQMHHIDAETEVERQKHRDATTGSGMGGGAGGQGAGRAGGGAGAPPARAIHMTIKSAGADGDEMVTETMADRLRAVQMEPWTRMAYVGDDDENSWDVYDQTLFLRAAAAAPAAPPVAEKKEEETASADGESVDTKGKGKEVEEAAAIDTRSDLVENVASLRTGWTEDEMLQAISGMPKPSGEAEAETAAAAAKAKAKKSAAIKAHKAKQRAAAAAAAAAAGAAIKEEPARDTSPPPAVRRARPGRSTASSATARGRGGRPRGGGRGSAMELD